MEEPSQFYEDPITDLSLLLMRTRRAMYKVGEKRLMDCNLSPEQFGVLRYLYSYKKATIADVTWLLLREPHTMLGLINRMEQKGMITKKQDSKRRNLIEIELTKEGEKLIDCAMAMWPSTVLFEDLNEEEQSQLRTILLKILGKSLDELDSYYRSPFKRRKLSNGSSSD